MKNMSLINAEYIVLSSGETTITCNSKAPIYVREVGSEPALGVSMCFGDSKEFPFAVEGKSTREGFSNVLVDGSEIDESEIRLDVSEDASYRSTDLVKSTPFRMYKPGTLTPETKDFTLWLTPFTCDKPTLTFTSTVPAVCTVVEATVQPNPLATAFTVTAVGVGESSIVIDTSNGSSYEFNVEILEPLDTSITITNKSDYTLVNVGDILPPIEYTISPPEAAQDVIFGVYKGNSKLIVTSVGGEITLLPRHDGYVSIKLTTRNGNVDDINLIIKK